jgi:hypothetical protein
MNEARAQAKRLFYLSITKFDFSEGPRVAITDSTELKHAMIGEMVCSVTAYP